MKTFREVFTDAKPSERARLLKAVEKMRPDNWLVNPKWIETAWEQLNKKKVQR